MNRRLLAADARRAARDPMVVVLTVLPLLLVAAWVLALPGVAERVADVDRMRVVQIVALVMLVLTTPLVYGLVAGLMLLDERDEGVLTVIAVSPLGMTRFIGYRLLLPAVWSAVGAAVVVVAVPNTLPVGVRVLLPILAALQAPLLTLFLGAFARNKVEGMALGKVANLVAFIGALAPLLPAPWLWAGAVLPYFWVVRLIIVPVTGGALALAGVGALAAHAAALVLLARVQRA
ncbi:MAG TPA: hypothetical protein VK928_13180 [Longimicrobiales bacterium]|nr:hypothetical protein [Longimicrobiales bacterium]